MGLIRTMSGFCYVECDTQDCNKKVENVDEGRLLKLAGWCGWKSSGKEWMCPECVNKEKSPRRSGRPTRSKKKTAIQL